MNLRDVLGVYRKELRETLRDWRTLVVLVVLPVVLYPTISMVASQWIIAHETKRQLEPSQILVAGAVSDAGPILAALEKTARLEVETRPGPLPEGQTGAALLGGKDLVLEVPARFERELAAAEVPAGVKIYFDGSDDDSKQARERVEEVLERLALEERLRRLEARGLAPSYLEPLALSRVDVATRAKLGRAELAKTLPFLIVMMVVLGAFYPAIDLTAGEKERGTLEALLATPTPRRAIVVGKYLTVATIAFATGLLNILALGGSIFWIARSAARASGADVSTQAVLGAIPWDGVALGLIAILAIAALFAGVMMAVATLARGFKEAQSYLMPVHFLATAPGFLAFMPGTALDYGTALVPVANVTLLLKGAIAGNLGVGPALLALGLSAIFAAGALSLATRVYSSERLLFAPEGARHRRALRGLLEAWRTASSEAGRSGAPGSREPDPGEDPTVRIGPGEALVVFGLVAVLFFLFAVELQSRGLGGFILSQIVLIALPVVAFARGKGPGVVDTLGLRLPDPRILGGAILIGGSAWYLNLIVGMIQEQVAPMPTDLRESFDQLAEMLYGNPLLSLLAFALTPAICEELLCRAVLARSFRRSLGVAGAVIVSSILFALLHLSFYRFVPQFLFGLSLGVVTLWARSVIPSMLIHALYNAGLLFASGYAIQYTDPRVMAPLAALALLAGHLVILRMSRRSPARPPR